MLLTRALDGVPHRVVSLNPSITEFLFLIAPVRESLVVMFGVIGPGRP
ncbi:hypothetical protein [Vulcanisaeta sp. JCM 14467]|nr:hypothetical protein [Vulcanisaeta sp. JCM 14467]